MKFSRMAHVDLREKEKKEFRRPSEFRFVGENRICVPQKHSRQFAAATILGLSFIWRGWDEITLYVQTQLFLTYDGYTALWYLGRFHCCFAENYCISYVMRYLLAYEV
jgi:hypothetical protein